ncbi:MAG: hypothetical protein SFU91_05820 [Chloroherpetonaceae bacterium]|nr:hypothetical protein [Chloroherpetonaceae bacterium]
MKNYKHIIFALSVFFINSCISSDFTLWKFNKKRIDEFDSTKVKFKTNGYYYMPIKENGIIYNDYTLIFFRNGYFCNPFGEKNLKNYKLKKIEDIRINDLWMWGRYEVER